MAYPLPESATDVQQTFARHAKPEDNALYAEAFASLGAKPGVTPDLIIGMVESGLDLGAITLACSDPIMLGLPAQG